MICFEDAGGIPEFTARGTGLSVPYLDIEAMAEGLAHLARNPDQALALATRGREEVAARHLPEHTGPRILDVLARAAQTPG